MTDGNFVVFDVGSTLLGFTDPRPFRRFLQDMQPERRVSVAEGRAFFDKWHATFTRHRPEARGIGGRPGDLARFWESVLQEVCAELPWPAVATAELTGRFDRGDLQQLFADVRPTLAALRRRGVPMGIISNFRPDLEDYLGRLRIRSYFRFVICSSVVGLAKPDPAIFDLGIRAAGCPPERIFYVGDDLVDDVEGALRAGLQAVLINRANIFPDARCWRINNLRTVESLI